MKVSLKVLVAPAFVAALALTAQPADALLFDQNITPDIIFGTGNTNGFFTVDQSSGVELGLRAKIPFTGTLHSGGDGTYSYSLAEANPRWNFDWTVNTDFDASTPTGNKISNFTYLLGIDFDPGLGTDFLTFDPITPNTAPLNQPFYDHSIGDNTTPNGGGTEATTAAQYQTLIDNNNVLQQSWRHAFFPIHPTRTYDPTIDGTYDIFLTAFDATTGAIVASTSIQAIIGNGGTAIPEPATLALFGIGLTGLGAAKRRRRRKTA